MTPKEFRKFLERDNFSCWHCGRSDDDLVPQHRRNRGMGGKNSAADQVSNIIVLCSEYNGLIESDVDAQQTAYAYGWKIGSNQSPLVEPVYDLFHNNWYQLDNNYGRQLYNRDDIV